MEFIIELWKPIVLAAVFVHVLSAIVWMASPLHKHDYKSPGDKEKPLLDFVRSHGFAPGVYVAPWCTGKDRKSAEFKEKMRQAPVMLSVAPGPMNMGRSMLLWIINLLIISVLVAYVSRHALANGAGYLKVFQVVGTVAFLAYGGNALTLSIWMGQPWRQVPGRVVDALLYGLVTAGTFGWLWPKLATGVPGV